MSTTTKPSASVRSRTCVVRSTTGCAAARPRKSPAATIASTCHGEPREARLGDPECAARPRGPATDHREREEGHEDAQTHEGPREATGTRGSSRPSTRCRAGRRPRPGTPAAGSGVLPARRLGQLLALAALVGELEVVLGLVVRGVERDRELEVGDRRRQSSSRAPPSRRRSGRGRGRRAGRRRGSASRRRRRRRRSPRGAPAPRCGRSRPRVRDDGITQLGRAHRLDGVPEGQVVLDAERRRPGPPGTRVVRTPERRVPRCPRKRTSPESSVVLQLARRRPRAGRGSQRGRDTPPPPRRR